MNKKDKAKSNLLRSGVSLSFLTLLSRIMGLVREMTKAAFLGTTVLGDVFTTAFKLPNLFRRLFAENCVSVAFIPTFKQYLENEQNDSIKKEETRAFVNATLTLVTFLTTVLTLICILAAPLYAPLMTRSTDASAVSELTILTRIMFPYLIVISVAALFQGILNGLKIFAPSGFTPILFNLIVIVTTYALAPHMANPARAMAAGTILGGTVQALFQLPFVLKTGWKVGFTSIKKAFTNPGTLKVIKLIGPTIIGMAAYQLNDLVSTTLAGNAGVGVQSSLSYSLRLQELILGIFAVSVSTVILPDLTGYAQQENFEKFNSLLTTAIRIMVFISIPVTAFSLVTGENIIRLIYQSRTFTDESVALTFAAFKWHITGLVFIALNRILAPAFYARNDTKSPTAAGLFNVFTNLVLAICLAGPLKGAGIALALSVASAVNTIFLFIFMKKKNFTGVGGMVKTTILYSLRMTVLSVIAAGLTLFVKKPLLNAFAGYNRFVSQGIPLLIMGIVFAATGVILMVITRDPLIRQGKALLNARRNRGK